jgi:hypothetical protein
MPDPRETHRRLRAAAHTIQVAADLAVSADLCAYPPALPAFFGRIADAPPARSKRTSAQRIVLAMAARDAHSIRRTMLRQQPDNCIRGQGQQRSALVIVTMLVRSARSSARNALVCPGIRPRTKKPSSKDAGLGESPLSPVVDPVLKACTAWSLGHVLGRRTIRPAGSRWARIEHANVCRHNAAHPPTTLRIPDVDDGYSHMLAAVC